VPDEAEIMEAVTRQAYELLHHELGASLFHEPARFHPSQRLRLLITGSREWQDVAGIKDALRPWWRGGTTTLVHGACPSGADKIADDIWRSAGGKVDPWPANWARYGAAAGPKRNAAMVAGGADFAIAFLLTSRPSPGCSVGTAAQLKASTSSSHVPVVSCADCARRPVAELES